MRSVASAFLLSLLFSLPAHAAVTVTSPQPASEPVVMDLGPPRGVCVGTEDECKAKKKDDKPDDKQGLLGKDSFVAG
jgi:hypothetical protein